MYDLSKPFKFHIELTDKCNARCPQCSRNFIDGYGGELKERPDLVDKEISFENFKNIFQEFNYSCNNISFCGNFGDPIFVKDIYEIIEYSCDKVIDDDGMIHIHTNGGFRSKKWWYDFGKMLSSKPQKHLVVFSLDGLEDTHHLYRVNTRYHRVLENARSFIEAGGIAEWSFIRFGHNEHQEEEARRRAKEYGFKAFIPIDTQRFWTRDFLDYEFRGKNYRITPSKNEAAKAKKLASKKYSNNPELARKKSKADIDCSVSNKNELFIDCEANVHPCCWIGSFEYRRKNYRGKVADPHEPELHPMFEMRTIRNAVTDNLNSIIEDDFFKYILPMSFDVSPCGICVRQCGKKEKVITTKEREWI